jgi:dihydropteroate synthase
LSATKAALGGLMIWKCGRFVFDLTTPVVMGILNVTPDSFSDGGMHVDVEEACRHARQMLTDGAGIIDVGGESTRPGSEEVSESEELRRVLPVVTRLADEGVTVSIDTRHSEVASAAVAAGAAIINDVSGFRDPAMRALASASDVGCVIMHMLGEPKSMQVDPCYDDVVAEVSAWLLASAAQLEMEGVSKERICIDPGPGFGKNFEHNVALLLATPRLSDLGYPLLAAWSRKRVIGDMTGLEEPAMRVGASAIVAAWAVSHGAGIVRVHDVSETVQAIRVFEYLQRSADA